MDEGKPSVGIDLGTTYSCVAVFQHGRPEVIANRQGNRITPSIVAFKNKERFIGESAAFQSKLEPKNAIYNAKKFIGRNWDDPVVQEKKAWYPYSVIKESLLEFFLMEKILNLLQKKFRLPFSQE